MVVVIASKARSIILQNLADGHTVRGQRPYRHSDNMRYYHPYVSSHASIKMNPRFAHVKLDIRKRQIQKREPSSCDDSKRSHSVISWYMKSETKIRMCCATAQTVRDGPNPIPRSSKAGISNREGSHRQDQQEVCQRTVTDPWIMPRPAAREHYRRRPSPQERTDNLQNLHLTSGPTLEKPTTVLTRNPSMCASARL